MPRLTAILDSGSNPSPPPPPSPPTPPGVADASDAEGGNTDSARPRLVIVRAAGVDADGLAAALADRYEVVIAEPGDAPATIDEGCCAVVAGPHELPELQQDLTARQSAALLNAMTEGSALLSPEGELLWSNASFRSMRTLVGGALNLAERCRDAADAFNRQLARADDRSSVLAPRRFNVALKKSQRYFECTLSPVLERVAGEAAPDETPTPPTTVSRLALVIRDVTERETTRRKIDALDRAGRELSRLDSEFIRDHSAVDRLTRLEERTVKYAHELLNFDHFAVRLLNKETGELELVMSSGLPEEAIGMKLYAGAEGQGISGYVAATGRSYICADAGRDTRYVFGLEHAGSSLTVPLKLFDEVIGVFNVESEEVASFSDQDRQFAEIFAGSLAMGLHILKLLVVERTATREDASGVMQGELSAPLNDLALEAEWLKEQSFGNAELSEHVERILTDVASIRRRVKAVAQGPRSLLGIEEAMEKQGVDPALHRKRVLVVDNEREIATTVRDILKNRGCTVVICDSGAAAIKLLDQWRLTHDAGEGFDLVISDINLGDKTGYDIFAAGKAAWETLPVILMTGFGYDPHHSIVRASQEGLQSVLFKPFQAESLVDECRKALTPGEGGAG